MTTPATATTLLIDADDTLWENIVVFNAINQAYVDWVSPAESSTTCNSTSTPTKSP